MTEEKTIIIQAIFNLNQWVKENLPIENSLIAYDLILLLSIYSYSKNNINVKNLFSSLPYSHTAIRHHYQRLINDGWIEHYLDTKDKRIKYVRPTRQFIETINVYNQKALMILTSQQECSQNT
jgi:DNA-binding MarR family transcriptional regulator